MRGRFQKAMGSCTAQCKMLFCANTVVRESAKFELARLKKEEEENRFWRFGDFLARYSAVHEQVKRYTRVTRETLARRSRDTRETLARKVASPRVRALLALASTHPLLEHSRYASASACCCARTRVLYI